MDLKKMIINSILLAVGAVLHQVVPPVLFGMKPDISLAMLFVILIFNRDYKICVCSGAVAGILAAATSAFPGGQFANIIDRLVTINVMFFLIKPLRDRISSQINIILATAVGTVVSGTTFLSVVLFTVGLSTGFKVLFLSVVLPAAAINTVVGIILFNIISIAVKRGKISHA
ncbi:MAG TPA: tryptophan transporter [Clostridium sp.]|jgi:hypothetical protein|uniref:Tryptophan transporter n=1 Tax=Clostridium lapidicellarium TaxID=3240931 RepID=A0ABV4DXE0_9CLOT|nr:tryptophan transporter [uncultured Clostridium sp.]NLU07025.1 tryptophan transporter [Clostridiales bacterium]HBC95281.1 tryptophan transporter [Clostridium sp.]